MEADDLTAALKRAEAELASEQKEFDLSQVANAIADKLERRHPHVFGEAAVSGSTQVLENWARLKAAERKKKNGHVGSVLDGVPKDAPGLQRAERLTEKASRIGFDWPDVSGVKDKLEEELGELDEAIASKDKAAMEHELGDVLFALTNLARHLGIAPEDAMRAANGRFTTRFHVVERGLEAQGVPFGEASLEQMNKLWDQAKAEEKARKRGGSA